MNIIEKRWAIAPRISPEAANNLEIYSPIFRQILFNRGIATAEEAENFLIISTPEHDPFLLLDMQTAVDRIVQAVEKNETIAVFGDYDADGVTASALLMTTLNALGANAQIYIPNRFDEGYGLNIGAIEKLNNDDVKLIITVDCGIRALPEVEYANSIGIDLIVTDHHTPGTELPPALAIINPKRANDPYPEKNLAGVGVAYKLACALISQFSPANLQQENLLDLVSIGTVADMVPLVGENRILVRRGLNFIRRPHRQGLRSLLGVIGAEPGNINATDIGFGIGPRINAAGRLGSALDAYNLLMTQDLFEAGQLAQALDNRNRERQRITREMHDKIEEIAKDEDLLDYIVFAADPEFNPGVVGLAASKLVEQYYRPAIVGHQSDEFTRASCRSIPEFNITNALEQCADLLSQYGGHAAAAGFTVPNENLEELIIRLKKISKQELQKTDLRPTITADIEVPLSNLKPTLLQELDQLQPTGYGNPGTVFVSRGLIVRKSRTVGKDQSHLKLTVSDGKITYDAIAFRLGEWQGQLPQNIDLIYTFERNIFNGRTSLQLNVKDIKPTQ